ncbi:MAG: ATP-dependent Clp protease ATP-binding subunit, partial [Clostridiales bacterium]|nr:ATP-dependent Clp protease ATP-binding subunit [Clostridiales bacterium]
MTCADTPVKDIIADNTPNMDALLEALGISGFESELIDRESVKYAADKAFGQIRQDVRRILSFSADVSRKTKSQGTVCPEHMLFVVLARKVSNHPEIFNALKEGECDLEGMKNSLVEIFSGGDQPDVPEEGDEDNGNPFRPEGSAGPKKSAAKKTKGGHKTLDKFGKNLTEAAKAGKIDPVIGREEEINRVMQILARRTKNNPCLVGDPGVGKTAIAEGLALKIAEDDVPDIIKGKTVYSMDMGSMVAGSKYRGDFEDRIKNMLEEAVSDPNVILFIDEIHTLVGAGESDGGSMDAANLMKPLLAKNELRVIGATTLDEYGKFIEKDHALERRFQKVMVNEPSVPDAIAIMKGLRSKYEEHHKIRIPDDVLEQSVRLSSR